MKNILFLLSFLFSSEKSVVYTNIQLPVNPETNLVSYKSTLEVEKASTEELHKKANRWFAIRYKLANDKLKREDNENNKFYGTGFVEVFKYDGTLSSLGGFIEYDINFTIKDGQIDYDITNFYHKGVYKNIESIGRIEKEFPGPELDLEYWNSYKKQLDDHIQTLITSLKQTIYN